MKKIKIKKHVYDYCGECFKIINLTKCPAWDHVTGTFMVNEKECPKCGAITYVQPVEGLFEMLKIVLEDKRETKRLEKANEEYWKSKKDNPKRKFYSVTDYLKYIKFMRCKNAR